MALDGEATMHPLEVPQHGIAFLQSGYVGEGKEFYFQNHSQEKRDENRVEHRFWGMIVLSHE